MTLLSKEASRKNLGATLGTYLHFLSLPESFVNKNPGTYTILKMLKLLIFNDPKTTDPHDGTEKRKIDKIGDHLNAGTSYRYSRKKGTVLPPHQISLSNKTSLKTDYTINSGLEQISPFHSFLN